MELNQSKQSECKCKTPISKCEHSRQKVNGIYCALDFTKQGEVEIGSLRYGDKFSFKETPWLTKKCLGQFQDGTRYEKECEWKFTEPNFKRIVDKV